MTYDENLATAHRELARLQANNIKEKHMEQITETTTTGINDLQRMYNETKGISSNATNELNNQFTLGGMESINKLVAETTLHINSFINNGKQSSTAKTVASKALAVVGLNSWADKWMKEGSDKVTEESLKEKTINEVVDDLIAKIDNERKQLVEYTVMASSLLDSMIAEESRYRELQTKAEEFLTTTKEYTMERSDTKVLITQIIQSLRSLESDIGNMKESLVAADITAGKIAAIMPTVENDLKYKGSTKVLQQKIADINGMVSAITDMTTSAGELIRKDVQTTSLATINMLADTGLDISRLKNVQKEELEHRNKVNEALQQTQDKINSNFEEIVDLQVTWDEQRATAAKTLLDSRHQYRQLGQGHD